MKNDGHKSLQWIVWLVSSGLIAYFSYFHIPWRDEAQAINLVADSTSWSDLFQRTRYEGHPFLWFALIKIFGGSSIPFIHAGIALIINFLIVFRARLALGLKLSLPFSYFFIFEYAVIYRNYSIGVLLLLLSVLFWRRNLKLTFAFLLLATQTNFFAAMLSGVLILLLFKEYRLHKRWGYGVLTLLTFIGLFYQLRVPEVGGFATDTHVSAQRIIDVFARLGQAYFPLQGEVSFPNSIWNSSLFTKEILVLLSLFTTGLLGISLPKEYRLIFWLTSAVILLFGILKLDGFLRHYGHTWILFILLLSLSGQRLIGLGRIWVILILAVQIASGLFIGISSSLKNLPFSQSTIVAQSLAQRGIQSEKVAVFPDNYGTAISLATCEAYYLPVRDTTMTHVIWDTKSQTTLYPQQLRLRLNSHFEKGAYFLISPYYIPDMHPTAFKDALLVETFEKAVTDESYFLFQLNTENNIQESE